MVNLKEYEKKTLRKIVQFADKNDYKFCITSKTSKYGFCFDFSELEDSLIKYVIKSCCEEDDVDNKTDREEGDDDGRTQDVCKDDYRERCFFRSTGKGADALRSPFDES